jgi:hypothetical protein
MAYYHDKVGAYNSGIWLPFAHAAQIHPPQEQLLSPHCCKACRLAPAQ